MQTIADGAVEIKIYGESGETAQLNPEMTERALRQTVTKSPI